MEYSKIVAVTGLPGLYELLTSKTDGAIVRSLEDKSTKFVSSRIYNFSQLESIEVFTKRENVNLVDVLKAIDESKEKLPDEKDNAALKSFFSKVYPDLDQDRVYASDLKKMIKWFTVLKNNNIEFKLSEPAVEEEEEKPAEEVVVEEKQKPTEKKSAAKKKEEAVAEEAPAEKPKKAAPKKAKAEDKAETEKETKKEPKKDAEAEAKPKKAAAKKKTDK